MPGKKEKRSTMAKLLEMSSHPRKHHGLTERLFLVTLYDENSKFRPAMEMLAEINFEFPVKAI